MNIHQFIVFDTISQFSSVSKAASKLFISQQALSSTIKNLEEELGTTLFTRSNKGVKLTQDGERVLKEIQPLLGHFTETINSLSASFHLPQNEVKIGIAQGVLLSLGQDMIGDIQKEFANVKLSLLELPDLDCEEKVNNNLLDFAFSLKPVTNYDLTYVHLKNEHMYALVNKENPLSLRSNLRLDELEAEDIILLWERSQFHDYTIEKCIKAGFEPNVSFECFELTSILDIIEENRGIFLGNGNIKISPKIARVPITDDTFLWKEGIVYSKEAIKNTIVKQIIEFVKKYFEET